MSTGSSQIWIQDQSGAKLTQQVTDQGSEQYLHPVNGYWYIQNQVCMSKTRSSIMGVSGIGNIGNNDVTSGIRTKALQIFGEESQHQTSQSRSKLCMFIAIQENDWRQKSRNCPAANNFFSYTVCLPPSSSVSNRSGLPGLGLGWNRTKGPGPGQEPPCNLNRVTATWFWPRPDINPWLFSWVATGPQFHLTDPEMLALLQYLSSDRIVTWSICRLCSFCSSSTSRF